MQLDAHDKPPAYLRATFKRYRNVSAKDLEEDEGIVDLCRAKQRLKMHVVNWRNDDEIGHAFGKFMGNLQPTFEDKNSVNEAPPENNLAYGLDTMPGLTIIPAVIPVDVQKAILSRLFHRDLQNPTHRTNVHLHHDVSYPPDGQSFFSCAPSHENMVEPKDSTIHKAMTIGQLMSKKLRWMTLGGQYDWTQKVYPNEEPPRFPPDLSDLLHGLFPQTKPEAAIVNLYSPGDTLSLHRDVSEECDRGLISLSIGCDAVFVVGLGNGDDDAQQQGSHLVVRVRSGDALYMADAVRYAWHGVPMIIPGTCPSELEDWPYESTEASQKSEEGGMYRQWRGWMAAKRINLNVRQMKP